MGLNFLKVCFGKKRTSLTLTGVVAEKQRFSPIFDAIVVIYRIFFTYHTLRVGRKFCLIQGL